jgi:predicted PurR-regulated permease PerM
MFAHLVGEQKEDITKLASSTIRSVVQGVLGVAFIQSVLAGIGMLAVGVPAAGLIALLVLIIAIIQLPTILILAPVIVYVFTIADTTPAIIFMIWTILVSLSDNFLKPLLFGRGVNVPMLVILLGAIGGMMTSGIIGLFLGAVILTLGYTVFTTLLSMDSPLVQKTDSNDRLSTATEESE